MITQLASYTLTHLNLPLACSDRLRDISLPYGDLRINVELDAQQRSCYTTMADGKSPQRLAGNIAIRMQDGILCAAKAEDENVDHECFTSDMSWTSCARN
jgi:hypothetical protein